MSMGRMLKEADTRSRRVKIDAKKNQQIIEKLDEVLESYKDLADDINKCYGATENGAKVLGEVVDILSDLKKIGWEPPTSLSYDRLSRGTQYMAGFFDDAHKQIVRVHDAITKIYNTIQPTFNELVKQQEDYELDREIDATDEDEDDDSNRDQSKGNILDRIFRRGK